MIFFDKCSIVVDVSRMHRGGEFVSGRKIFEQPSRHETSNMPCTMFRSSTPGCPCSWKRSRTCCGRRWSSHKRSASFPNSDAYNSICGLCLSCGRFVAAQRTIRGYHIFFHIVAAFSSLDRSRWTWWPACPLRYWGQSCTQNRSAHHQELVSDNIG